MEILAGRSRAKSGTHRLHVFVDERHRGPYAHLFAQQAALRQKAASLPAAASLEDIARVSGLGDLAHGAGLVGQALSRCLADQGEQALLTALKEAAKARGVAGMPTFAIDDVLVEPAEWRKLAPLLRGRIIAQ